MCDKPTIIIVGRQAGTANAFTPVIRALERDQQLDLVILGISHAYDAWQQNNVTAMKVGSFNEAVMILDGIHNPRFMLTGTSLMAVEDAQFWNWAERRSIPTLAFVDSWINYYQRFSYNLPGVKKRFDLLPEKIAVIDELAATRMKKLGCPPNLLLVTGNPAFDEFVQFDGIKNNQLRNQIISSGYDYLVLFVSEPLSQIFGPNARAVLGYTEEDSLSWTLAALEQIGKNYNKRFCVAVKLHPREGPEKIAKVLELHKTFQYVTSLMVNEPRLALVAASDIVIGMTSMLLYEASLMGCPVMSVQPNRLQECDLVDSHSGIEVITDEAALLPALELKLGGVFSQTRRGNVQGDVNSTSIFASLIFDSIKLKLEII